MNDTVKLTPLQQQLLDACNDTPQLPGEIADSLGLTDAGAIGANLGRLERAGLLTKDRYGRYAKETS